MTDRYVKLQPSERWMHDGESTLKTASAFGYEDVDMTASQEIIAQARSQGIKCTYTHIIARAVALVFKQYPDFNRLLLKGSMIYPDQLDIGIAVHTDYELTAPFEIVIHDAMHKDLTQTGEEIIKLAAYGRTEGDRTRHEKLNKLSRIFFASWMRRAMYRKMSSKMEFIRKTVGSFHISSTPGLKLAGALRFPTSANLVIARVEDRPVVRDGQIVVRPMCTIGFIADHRLWNGTMIGCFFSELKRILESGELAKEIPAHTNVQASTLIEALPSR